MLNFSNFSQTLDGLLTGREPECLVVAVSGGADSLCLTLLANRYCQKKGLKCLALTVDHGLRPESLSEARQVQKWLSGYGILHRILTWTGEKPKTCVEEKAREARYSLLLSACRKEKKAVLLLAHHLDDQMETFLLRLAHGSGVDGLSAMFPVTCRDDVWLVRPFLNYRRSEIQNYLKKQNQEWIEDPSNQSDEYERVRFRKAQGALSALGLTPAAIGMTASRLQSVRRCLEKITDDFFDKKVEKNPAGYFFVKESDFNALDDEIKIRLIIKMLKKQRGQVCRLSQVESLIRRMPCRETLCGCQLVWTKKGFYLCAEYAKLEGRKKIKPNQKSTWEKFEVKASKPVWVGALGNALRQKGVPSLVSRTFPAFFDEKGHLLAVPLLDYEREDANIKGTTQLKE